MRRIGLASPVHLGWWCLLKQTVPALIFSLSLLPGKALSTTANNPDPIARCAESISSITSHDVVARIRHVNWRPSHGEDIHRKEGLDTITRDVFAVGLGRRIETSIDDETFREVAVIDGKTAKAKGRPLSSKPRGFEAPGTVYHDYVNPSVGGLLLADLLSDRSSLVTPLPSSLQQAQRIGVQVQNRLLKSPVRLWLHPGRGYLPSMIEYRDVGPAVVIHMEEFAQIQDGAWVPVRATFSQVLHEPWHSGCEMVVDQERSSWNAISSDQLFGGSNVPGVNFREDGWKFHYSAARLTTLREVAAAERNRRLARVVLVIALGLALGFGLWFFSLHYRRAQVVSPVRPRRS